MRNLLAAACLLLVACSDSTGPAASVAGTYDLTAIDGERLPYEILGQEILSGTLLLREGGTFTSSIRSRYEDFVTGEMEEETETESGTYSRDGRSLFLNFDGETEDAAATYEDGTITVNTSLVSFRFEHQG